MNDTPENPHVPVGEKLQKVLARLGVGSRRDVEVWIAEGRVNVNGSVASLGQRVDSHDAITVDGHLIRREEAAESVRRVLIYTSRKARSAPATIRKAARPSSTACRACAPVAGSMSVAWTSIPPACCCSPPMANWPTA